MLGIFYVYVAAIAITILTLCITKNNLIVVEVHRPLDTPFTGIDETADLWVPFKRLKDDNYTAVFLKVGFVYPWGSAGHRGLQNNLLKMMKLSSTIKN